MMLGKAAHSRGGGGGRSQAHVEDITEIWFLWHIYSAMVHAQPVFTIQGSCLCVGWWRKAGKNAFLVTLPTSLRGLLPRGFQGHENHAVINFLNKHYTYLRYQQYYLHMKVPSPCTPEDSDLVFLRWARGFVLLHLLKQFSFTWGFENPVH